MCEVLCFLLNEWFSLKSSRLKNKTESLSVVDDIFIARSEAEKWECLCRASKR